MTDRRSDADFAEEIRAHIALEADRLMADGMPPDEARAVAARRFGNTLRARERFYESRRWPWLDQLATDVRHAARGLLRYPVSCLIAVVSLGAGIGMTTVTLMVRHAVFVAPPPHYAEPSQLSLVGLAAPDRDPAPVPAALFNRWMEDPVLAASFAAHRGLGVADVRAGDLIDAVGVRAVSPDMFTLLGVPAAIGRTFDVTKDAGGPQTPVVLSHHAWQTLFGGRADVLGRELRLNDVPYAVIGVMPEFFWLVGMDAPVWTMLDEARLAPTDLLTVIARRSRDVTPIDLSERLQTAATAYLETLPPEQRRVRAAVAGIEGTPTGRAVGPMILVLLATSVLLTLLIACANVAMLMIAQWTTREHEIAIRASLGASRSRIVRGLIAESMLIAAAGGALGLAVTLGLRAILLRGDDAPHFNMVLDPRIFATAAAATILAGIVTGAAPALYETRALQINPLRRMRLSDRVRQRWRHALVVFEIGVTVGLLVVALAIISAAQRTMTAQPGFDTHPIVVVRIAETNRLDVNVVLERVRSIAGVTAAAAASNVPIQSPPPSQPVALDRLGRAETHAERTFVSPAYFHTLGVALRSGRDFSATDDAQALRVAIVDETLAARLWPNGNPVGEHIWSGDAAYQVVGVSPGLETKLLRAPRPAFYLPLAQKPDAGPLRVVVRASGDPGRLDATLRRDIGAVVPAGAVVTTIAIDTILDIGSREIAVGAFPMVPLIATGLLLTSAGIFSVLAFAVARRSNELAVRVAVGAEHRDLVRMLAAQSARLIGVGLVMGIGVTFAVTQVAQGTGSVFDSPGWRAFLVPIAIVTAIGIAATWVPLRRALRINPAVLLRAS